MRHYSESTYSRHVEDVPFLASWRPCTEFTNLLPVVKREKTKKMQQSDVYYQLLSQHVSGIIMPIFRRTKTVCYWIRCSALVLLNVVAVVGRPTTATNHIQQNQRSTPRAVTHVLVS